MTYAAEGNRATAQRMDNAERAFVAQLVEIAACTEAEAWTVLRLYVRAKIAKMDAVGGRISVTHGAFLDCRAVLRAIAIARTANTN